MQSDNVIRRLILGLRKISLFYTCFHIVWGLLIVMAFFVDFYRMTFPIPTVVVCVVSVAIVIGEVYIWFRTRADRYDKKMMWTYGIYNYIVPFIISLIKVIFFDNLFYYSGGFFPGLDALGTYVFYIGLLVIFVIGFIVYCIVNAISRKRLASRKEAEGTEDDSVNNAMSVKVTDCINLVLVAAFILCMIGLLITFCVEKTKEAIHHKELSDNEKYRAQVLTDLIESDVYEKAMWKGVNDDGTIARDGDEGGKEIALFEEAEYEICWEAYSYSLFVEAAAKDTSVMQEDNWNLGMSSVTPQVIQNGVENYKEFTKRYKPETGVAMEDQKILYDEKNKTVSASSKLYCIDEETDSMVNACMVVVFDKNWKVIEIRCQEEALVSNDSY